MRYGVITARRGWLEKKDVLNTLPLEEFLAALRPKPARPFNQARTTKNLALLIPSRRSS